MRFMNGSLPNSSKGTALAALLCCRGCLLSDYLCAEWGRGAEEIYFSRFSDSTALFIVSKIKANSWSSIME